MASFFFSVLRTQNLKKIKNTKKYFLFSLEITKKVWYSISIKFRKIQKKTVSDWQYLTYLYRKQKEDTICLLLGMVE